MECPSKSRDGEAWLLAHVAGQLDAPKARWMAAHLRNCRLCAAAVRDQSAVWDLLDRFDTPAVGPQWTGALRRKIAEEPPASRVSRFFSNCRNWTARPALPLAVLTVLVTVGLFVDRSGAPQFEIAVAPVATSPVAAQPVTPRDVEQLGSALEEFQLLQKLDLVKDEATPALHRR